MKIIVKIVLSNIFLFQFIFTQQDNLDLSIIPKMLGAINVGKDFWFSCPPCPIGQLTISKFTVLISSFVKTNVTVEIKNKGYIESKKTVPNSVIHFEMAPDYTAPHSKIAKLSVRQMYLSLRQGHSILCPYRFIPILHLSGCLSSYELGVRSLELGVWNDSTYHPAAKPSFWDRNLVFISYV